MARKTDKEELEAFETLLVKVQHPNVFPKLADFAYEATALAADQTLAASAHTARTAQQKEAAEARAASVQEDQAQDTLRMALVQLHRILDLANRKNKTLQLPHILGLQTLPRTEAAFLDYAASLLDRLDATPEALDAVAPFGVDTARLTALRTLLTAARTAGQTQDKEAAEAQQATVLYYEIMAQVRLAQSMLLTLTREACKDYPDLLAMFD